MNERSIPKATLGRLPLYLNYLRRLPPTSGPTISATQIARQLYLGEVQVRKDLAAVSGAGKPRIGYVVRDLIENLESALGGDQVTQAVLVGAGKLGGALLEYNGFEEYGIQIVAAFDRDDQAGRTSRKVGAIRLVGELESFCREHDIRLGIITVNSESAQEVCDRMVDSGIKAIWNFAPCGLSVPEDILLKQENFALSLAHLNNLLCNRI